MSERISSPVLNTGVILRSLASAATTCSCCVVTDICNTTIMENLFKVLKNNS